MQLPHSRSEELNNKVWIPKGVDQSLLVEPNIASVGIPETHAICIKPESSDKTNFVF